jgi:predicted RNA-binding Zn-ribbon protein involved in translation (DUF1610 family)
MWANEPEMARRWQRHTRDAENLPERVDEVKLEDDPTIDPDEREELHSQLGDYEVDQGDDDDVPEGELVKDPPQMTPAERSRREAMMMDALLDDSDDPPPDDEAPVPEETISDVSDEMIVGSDATPASEPARAHRGEYDRSAKSAATIDPSLYDMDHKTARADIGDYADDIDDLHDAGYTFGQIAKRINSVYGLKTHPGRQNKKSGPGARRHDDLRCQECGGRVDRTASSFICRDCGEETTRALTPSQVSDYLKFTGKVTRGPASRFQDLGSRMEHNHDLDDVPWKEGCPACSWSTGFDSDPESETDAELKEKLIELGEFTTEEAITEASALERFQMDIKTPYFEPCDRCGDRRRVKTRGGDIACRSCGKQYDISEIPLPKFYQKRGYSDQRLPKNFRNLADYVIWTLKNDPDFEPVDDDWSEKMWTTRPLKIRWRYTGQEGDDEMNELREMFGESLNKEPGEEPFNQWNQFGTSGNELKKAADKIGGDVTRTQTGQLKLYGDQMGVGQAPMVANIPDGEWVPEDMISQVNPHDTSSQNSAMRGTLSQGNLMGSSKMERVFRTKTGR